MSDHAKATTFKLEINGVSSTMWVAEFEGEEAISELFRYELTLTSDDKDIALADAIGKPALLTLETDKSEPRHVHGIIARFEHRDDGKKLSAYHATLVPKVWRLQHRRDSRIFQEMAVPDILKKVLGDAGVTDFRLAVEGSHPAREYCVQYRESDWAFITRLMEEEGICYYFEHSEGSDVLVMADSPSGHAPIPGTDHLTFRPALGAMAHGESVSRISLWEEVRPGKVSLSDFNFEKPSLSLLTSTAGTLDTDLEIYDYPGEYTVPGDGSTLAKIRLEEAQSTRQVGEGESGCVRLTAGYLFSITDHSRDAVNRKYLITRVWRRGIQPQMGEAGGAETPSYTSRFRVIPDDVPFRPERRTPRPMIRGVQTAIVTGPGGEEIYTDKHGRVKVQFHWDRLGKKDDKSSCWIRVSQVWAGAGWGAMHIPRIGQEVVVDFIEGDPDRPIITGRVYHGTNVPPYPLPAEKTKSTIKSDSSMGHGGNNELRFEDKKGSEEIWLHGQKDWNVKIENDKNQWIGHDETKEVVHDRAKKIGHDETSEIDHDRKKLVKHDQYEQIDHDKTIKVGNNHSESIGANEKVGVAASADRSVGASQTESISVNSTLTVGAVYTVAVGAAMSMNVGGALAQSVGAMSTESVVGNKSLSAGGNMDIAVGKKMSTNVGGDEKENITGEKTVEVGKKFTLQVGEGTITVDKDGIISVSGKDITVKGSGKINVEAGSKVFIKSDGPVDVEASGAVKVKGSKVEMN